MIWLGWLLATCGFGILLGGVAAMQQVGFREGAKAMAGTGSCTGCPAASLAAAFAPLLQFPAPR